MNQRSLLFPAIITAAFIFGSCSGGSKESNEKLKLPETPVTESESTTEGTAQYKVDSAFQDQLTGVFKAYVPLKDALVKSDVEAVKKGAAAVHEALSKTDMMLLSDAAHHDWMVYLQQMEAPLKTMQEATNIEVQRKSFSDLSGALYKSIKAYGLTGATAFYDFCPMAFNNKGGYWLSDQESIRNPYFGDQMLTCGEVIEEIK